MSDDEAAWGEALAKRARMSGVGHVQRASVDKKCQPQVAKYSHLARYLLEEYAFGGLSANAVQKLAEMASLDGLKHPDVERLAGFGTRGKHTGNIDRDLRRYVKDDYLGHIQLPDASAYPLPLKILKGPEAGVHLMPHYYMAPHVLMSFLHRNFPKDFEAKILGTESALGDFWAGVKSDDPRVVQLRKDHPDYKKWCVPLVIHGDGVPCTKNHSLDTLSFESLLSKRSSDKHYSTLDYIFFMSGVFNQTMVSDKKEDKDDTSLGITKKEMWKPLVHSLRALYTGVWPQKDAQAHDITGPPGSDDFKRKGEYLAGGYKFVIWVSKGDMEFAINHYQTPGHWTSHHPCPACPCTRDQTDDPALDHYTDDPAMRWNDFRPKASWMSKTFKCMEAYKQHCRMKRKQVHLVFQPMSQGGLGVHVTSQYKDALHVCDMGVTKHACSNVLWLLCYTDMVPGGKPPHENMAQLWGEIDDLYKARGTSSQFSFLGLKSFCDPEKPNADYPMLGGKGAEMRHLLPILRAIWCKYARAPMKYEQVVLQVLNRLCAFYEALEYKEDGSYPFHLPTAVSDKMLADVEACLQYWTFLAKVSIDQDKKLWNVVPKHHYFWHLAEEASHLNPRMSWCYSNEDFVGKLATIGLSCRHGQAAAFRSKQLCDKYILGFTLRLFHSIAI